VSKALEEALGEAESAKLVWRPQNTNPVDVDQAKSLMKLIDALEDDDDIQNVTSNADFTDEVIAALGE